MAATIIERWDSRDQTISSQSSSSAFEMIYVTLGSDDDAEIRDLVAAEAPTTIGSFRRKQFRLSPLGAGLWEVHVSYSLTVSQFSFDTSGGTQHITQSRRTVNKYGTNAPDFQGAIGVSSDSVEGTDITVPIYAWSETHYLAASLVTEDYKNAVFNLTGRVNTAAFRAKSPGEVLFKGASGSARGYDDWEISFRFEASPNVMGLAIGSITGINKRGWEYLWIRYADDVNQNTLIKKPVAVYIEEVYPEGDFSVLGIGT